MESFTISSTSVDGWAFDIFRVRHKKHHSHLFVCYTATVSSVVADRGICTDVIKHCILIGTKSCFCDHEKLAPLN